MAGPEVVGILDKVGDLAGSGPNSGSGKEPR